MRPSTLLILAALAGGPWISCLPIDSAPTGRDIETALAFTNFSTRFYAALGIRAHDADPDANLFVLTPLLAPGATYRVRFLELLGVGCPASVDLQLFLYPRTNDDVPIGLDPDEAVDATPVVAGQVLNIPACRVQTLEAYTVVNWDAPLGSARVKIAQNTAVDEAIRAEQRFANSEAVWELHGVDPAIPEVSPPMLASSAPIAGRVIQADGTGVEGIGVLLRTRFRVRLDDADPTNDPDAGFGLPIAVATTDAGGGFAFRRPPGAYRIDFFSDDFAFRPGAIDVETPIDVILVVAEPIR